MVSKISRYGPVVVAWLLLIGVTGAFYALVVPGIIKEFRALGVLLTIVESILFIGVVVNFFMATIMDPGVLPKATESEEQQQDEFRAPLYKNVEVRGISVRMKWCTTCHFYRPPRCSHCSICDHCIDTFDHHCPWLNNCIGRRNYRQFFVFLILLSLHIVVVFTLCLIYTLKMKNNLLTKENLGSMIVMVLGGMLFVPIIGLTGFHVFLVVTGRTTNEQVTGKFRSGYNPFNKGICQNLASVCFGPQFPKFSGYADRRASDLERMARDKTRNPGAAEATSPLLHTDTVPTNNRHAVVVAASNMDSAHVTRAYDERRERAPAKRQQHDDILLQRRLLSGNSADSKRATPDDLSVMDGSRGSFASRSRSSAGEQHSDEISLSQIATNETSGASLSHDSSFIRVVPKSGSGGFPQHVRMGDTDGSGISSMEAQGSKCNLLDETGSALAAPGIIYSKRVAGGNDADFDGVEYKGRPNNQEFVSSPGNERYQQALREAYSGTSVQHKPPVAPRPSVQQPARRGILQNGPAWSTSEYGGNSVAPAGRYGGGSVVQRFAYVPPSSLLESSVVNKSQSMDALGRQGTVPSSSLQYDINSTAPRLTLAPTLSSSAAEYNSSSSGYKRPLSFTQAVQLHDSLTRLNNTNRSPGGAYVTRQRPDTAGSTSPSSPAGNVNEIRV